MVSTQPSSTVTTTKFNTLAIVGFIFAFLISFVGIILGAIALVQIRRTGERGHGLALAAVVLGVIFLIIGIVVDVSVLPQIANMSNR